ncbi:MAG: hypothetical protein Q9222_004118 [Ikaeria aurantiellina]
MFSTAVTSKTSTTRPILVPPSLPSHRIYDLPKYDEQPSLNETSHEQKQTAFPFLELPREIRDIIYDQVLPDVFFIKKGYQFHFAILKTSHKVQEEAKEVLRRRRHLSVRIHNEDDYKFAIQSIHRLGDVVAPRLTTLDIDAWFELDRQDKHATFGRCILRLAFDPIAQSCTFQYAQVAPGDHRDYLYPTLDEAAKPSLHGYLRALVNHAFTVARHRRLGLDAGDLESMVDGILLYTKYPSLLGAYGRPVKGAKKSEHSGQSERGSQVRWRYIYPDTVGSPRLM